MMAKAQRDKGRRGQTEAMTLLAEYGFTVIEANAGRACEDLIAIRDGVTYCVEVKHHRKPDLPAFKLQARIQAKARKLPWLLMVRWPDHPYTFAVEGKGVAPDFWRRAS